MQYLPPGHAWHWSLFESPVWSLKEPGSHGNSVAVPGDGGVEEVSRTRYIDLIRCNYWSLGLILEDKLLIT